MSRPVRCAEAALQRGDPCHASAPPAHQWLLLEHPGPWGRRILTDAGIALGVATELGRWAEQTGSRVLLIRRPGGSPGDSPAGSPGGSPGDSAVGSPGRRTGGWPRRWCWADARRGAEQIRWGSYHDDAEILDVLRAPAPAGQPSHEPVYLVCAHGKHDVCCALRGRPVAAALATTYPQRTWECSHLGGDRFAANLVVLPHGLYYGHVPPTMADGIAEEYDRGRLSLPWLRGRSCLPAPVQAAQHFARTVTGETGVDSYPPLYCEPTEPEEWTVRLGGPDGQPLTMVVRARMQTTAEPLTCAGTGPGRFRVFELISGMASRQAVPHSPTVRR